MSISAIKKNGDTISVNGKILNPGNHIQKLNILLSSVATYNAVSSLHFLVLLLQSQQFEENTMFFVQIMDSANKNKEFL